MCGIAGLVLFREILGFDPVSIIQTMTHALKHRGPDDIGFYQKDNVHLGHSRLSIIDIAGGHQPIFSPEGDAIVGNGEIYNYPELRQLIQFQDYKSASDFEPALHICLETGIETGIEEWRGMYAAALHLPQQKLLVLARDPFGIKPLYYTQTSEYLAFSSEPRSFIAADLASSELDLQAVHSLLNLNYVPFEKTVFKNIKRVLPGEIIKIDNGINTRLPERTNTQNISPTNPEKSLAKFDQLFEESILIHQRSDVPYGLFLSGGLDSTSILTMMVRLNNNPVKTFTCGFDSETVHDERDAARQVAKHFNTDHHETIFTRQDFIDLLPQVAWALDDPTIDPAILPTYKLGELAKDHVKVILSGEGGDEVFGGYGRYRKYCRPRIFGGKKFSNKRNLEKLKLNNPWQDPLLSFQDDITSTYTDPLRRIQYFDIKTWLPADLLLKLDRCLMAHSLEGRTPFLDKKIFEFGFNLPQNMKINRKQGKWLLRQWLAQHCPAADAFGRKKGFTVPVYSWIKHYYDDLLPLVRRSEGLLSLMHKEQIEAGLQSKQSAWPLLFYAVWHKVHIEGCDPSADLFEILN